VEVWQTSNLRTLRLGEEKKKEERKKKTQGKNIMVCPIPYGDHNKCVSRVARRKSHHTALRDAAAPIPTAQRVSPRSFCPGVICMYRHFPRCDAYIAHLGVMPPRDSTRAKVHQNERSSSRIVVEQACKVSCRYLFQSLRNP